MSSDYPRSMSNPVAVVKHAVECEGIEGGGTYDDEWGIVLFGIGHSRASEVTHTCEYNAKEHNVCKGGLEVVQIVDTERGSSAIVGYGPGDRSIFCSHENCSGVLCECRRMVMWFLSYKQSAPPSTTTNTTISTTTPDLTAPSSSSSAPSSHNNNSPETLTAHLLRHLADVRGKLIIPYAFVAIEAGEAVEVSCFSQDPGGFRATQLTPGTYQFRDRAIISSDHYNAAVPYASPISGCLYIGGSMRSSNSGAGTLSNSNNPSLGLGDLLINTVQSVNTFESDFIAQERTVALVRSLHNSAHYTNTSGSGDTVGTGVALYKCAKQATICVHNLRLSNSSSTPVSSAISDKIEGTKHSAHRKMRKHTPFAHQQAPTRIISTASTTSGSDNSYSHYNTTTTTTTVTDSELPTLTDVDNSTICSAAVLRAHTSDRCSSTTATTTTTARIIAPATIVEAETVEEVYHCSSSDSSSGAARSSHPSEEDVHEKSLDTAPRNKKMRI